MLHQSTWLNNVVLYFLQIIDNALAYLSQVDGKTWLPITPHTYVIKHEKFEPVPSWKLYPHWLVVLVLKVLFLLLHEKVTINLAVMNPRSYTNGHLQHPCATSAIVEQMSWEKLANQFLIGFRTWLMKWKPHLTLHEAKNLRRARSRTLEENALLLCQMTMAIKWHIPIPTGNHITQAAPENFLLAEDSN